MPNEEPEDGLDKVGGELAKAAGKEISRAVGELLLRALGPAADEAGEIIRAELRAWRWRRRNVEQIAEKQKMEGERRGINPDDLHPLPEGDAYRVLEACSLEDDETVQSLWAGLLTSAMDPRRKVSASKVFVELLKSIGPAEAGLLLILHRIATIRMPPKEQTMKAIQDAREEARDQVEALARKVWRHFGPEDCGNAVQNLMRLRCVGYRTGKAIDKDQIIFRETPVGVSARNVPTNLEAVVTFFDYLESLTLAVSGTSDLRLPSRRTLRGQGHNDAPPEARYQLTSLGRSLVSACLDADGTLPPDLSFDQSAPGN